MLESKIKENANLIKSMHKDNDNDRDNSHKTAKENYEREVARIDAKHESHVRKIHDLKNEHNQQLEAMRNHISKVASAENIKEEHDRTKEIKTKNKEVADMEYAQAKYFHKITEDELKKHHDDFLKIHSHGTQKVQSTKNIHSINHHNDTEVNNRSTASSKLQSKGFGIGKALKKILAKRPFGLENELHFEDVAHFSANRENRCTYI